MKIRVLKLLPGLRWRGKLTVKQRVPEGFIVAFDAKVADQRVAERFVYDQTVLTAKQLHDWTGETIEDDK